MKPRWEFRDLWGLLSGCGWRGGAEAQGRRDRGERWSSILPEVNGASGGLRPFAAAGGVRTAVPARKGPAAREDHAVEVHRGLDTGGSHDVSHWNGAVAGWDRPAPRDSVARTRITPPHSGQAGTWTLAREVAVSAVAVSKRSICWAKADRQEPRPHRPPRRQGLCAPAPLFARHQPQQRAEDRRSRHSPPAKSTTSARPGPSDLAHPRLRASAPTAAGQQSP